MALPGLIDTPAQLLAWRSLLWLSMTWRRRCLTHSNFLSTTSLIWSLALHLLFCFSQEKPLRWKEINTHTHIQSANDLKALVGAKKADGIRHIYRPISAIFKRYSFYTNNSWRSNTYYERRTQNWNQYINWKIWIYENNNLMWIYRLT